VRRIHRFLHFPAHARRYGKASVGGAVRGEACLGMLAEKTNESGAILAKHVLSSSRAPNRRGAPERGAALKPSETVFRSLPRAYITNLTAPVARCGRLCAPRTARVAYAKNGSFGGKGGPRPLTQGQKASDIDKDRHDGCRDM